MSRNAPFKAGSVLRLHIFLVILLATPVCGRAADSELSHLESSPPKEIVIVEDPLATRAFRTSVPRVEAMLNRALTNLTGKSSVPAAWGSLVSTQDIVGLKVFAAPGPNTGTRPAVVEAVVKGLLSAGLPPTNIVIWDRNEADVRLAGFSDLARRLGVGLQGAMQAGYDENVYYEKALVGNLRFGDLEFGKQGDGVGRRSFASKLLTHRVTKIINITPVLNKLGIGVVGHLYSLAMGSMDNTWRFERSAQRLAEAVPEIYALPALSDRVVLNITDALICQYEGEKTSLLHYSAPANQIFLSHDPVALDVLSLKTLLQHRMTSGSPEFTPNLDTYRNAALLELGAANLDRVPIRRFRQGEDQPLRDDNSSTTPAPVEADDGS